MKNPHTRRIHSNYLAFFNFSVLSGRPGAYCSWETRKGTAGWILSGHLRFDKNEMGEEHAGKSRDLRCQYRKPGGAGTRRNGTAAATGTAGGRRGPADIDRGESAPGAVGHPALRQAWGKSGRPVPGGVYRPHQSHFQFRPGQAGALFHLRRTDIM